MAIIMPGITGVTISEHQIRGRVNGIDDTSLENIAKLYNKAWADAGFPLTVTWQEIADLNFGAHTVKAIYDWLSTHGGTRQSPYSGHSSGYHWSFTVGQVLKVPGPLSLSYPDSNATVAIGDPDAPVVQPSTPSYKSDSQAVPQEETQKLAEKQTSSPVAEAGMGLGWLVGIGLMVGAIIFAKKNSSATRSGGKRQRASRRGRRR